MGLEEADPSSPDVLRWLVPPQRGSGREGEDSPGGEWRKGMTWRGGAERARGGAGRHEGLEVGGGQCGEESGSKNKGLELNASRDREPEEGAKQRGSMRVASLGEYKMSSKIE
ncbi:UNVERIFIED_CONTAM: hypothetical protein FKN15_049779 [Acipenser sinensis]